MGGAKGGRGKKNDESDVHLPKQEKMRVINEVKTLQSLENNRIIKFEGSWFNKEKQTCVFITELVTSGNLSE